MLKLFKIKPEHKNQHWYNDDPYEYNTIKEEFCSLRTGEVAGPYDKFSAWFIEEVSDDENLSIRRDLKIDKIIGESK